MNSWLLRECYGTGAGRIALPAIPHQRPTQKSGLRDALTGALGEIRSADTQTNIRRAISMAPAIGLVLVLWIAMISTLFSDYSDPSTVELVMLETPPLQPIVEPEPEPIIEPEPEPVPQIAEAAVEVPRIVPVPEPPRVAQVPPPRVERAPEPPPVAPRPRRVVQIDAVAPVPEPRAPEPPPERTRRPDRVEAQRRIAAIAPLPAVPQVVSDEAPRPERFRTLAAPPTPERRVAAIDPLLVAQAVPPPPSRAPVRRSRTTRPAPDVTPHRNVELDPLTAAVPDVPIATTRPDRVTRRVPTAPKERSRSVAPAAAPTSPAAPQEYPTEAPTRVARAVLDASQQRTTSAQSLSVPATRAPALPKEPTKPVARQRVARFEPKPDRAAMPEKGLEGVPLGSLAACLDDRQEDWLKQKVVAAASTHKQCVSEAGTYRFVETKNLNAFLMWIQRSADRTEGDRCTELELALKCLQGTGARTGKRRNAG